MDVPMNCIGATTEDTGIVGSLAVLAHMRFNVAFHLSREIDPPIDRNYAERLFSIRKFLYDNTIG
jgi:hypothetical protein